MELTVTVKGFNGVAPEVTLVESQLPPLVVVDATVKETAAEPEVLVTLRDWAAGLDANAVEKVSEVGVTVTLLLAGGVPPLPPPLTTRTTGIRVGLLAAPVWLTEMEPLYTPVVNPV